jgi:hypothetical protein
VVQPIALDIGEIDARHSEAVAELDAVEDTQEGIELLKNRLSQMQSSEEADPFIEQARAEAMVREQE